MANQFVKVAAFWILFVSLTCSFQSKTHLGSLEETQSVAVSQATSLESKIPPLPGSTLPRVTDDCRNYMSAVLVSLPCMTLATIGLYESVVALPVMGYLLASSLCESLSLSPKVLFQVLMRRFSELRHASEWSYYQSLTYYRCDTLQ